MHTPRSWLAELLTHATLIAARERVRAAPPSRGRAVDDDVGRRGSPAGASADATPMRTPCVSAPDAHEIDERGERRQITGVVARERGDRHARSELRDHGALVDRNRRAQLHCHAAALGASIP